MSRADLTSLPSVDRLLGEPRLAALLDTYSRAALTDLVRSTLGEVRAAALAGTSIVPSQDQIVTAVIARAETRSAPWPARVINATGVMLHTNLGRAPLSQAAIAAASAAAGGYSDLEFDLATGRRGSRNRRISEVIEEATGAEAGLVVNNNASAVLLVLAALAGHGGEVIVSRGEAVEIGGGFRVPDVMRQSGAKLVEVGTTNKTYASDYDGAITDRTAAILRVHPSNFTLAGFTHSPTLPELVEVGVRRNVPVLHDLGSGSLIDTSRFGLAREPLVQESVDAGVGLTMFSGDKLLGGPQAGLVVGSRELVEQVARHPLARALRTDKVTLAALGATLRAYVRGSAESEIPVWRMISAGLDTIRDRAAGWRDAAGTGEVVEARSTVGGGSLPGQELPTFALSIQADCSADEFLRRLRNHAPPVIARIENDHVILDPRTVAEDEDVQVADAIRTALG